MSDMESVTATEVPTAAPGAAGAAGAAGVAGQPGGLDKTGKPRSLAGDAWRDLRRNPIFWIAGALVVVLVVMAIVPSLFTSTDPRACALGNRLQAPGGSHVFGTDTQGCDVYARTIYGARSSIAVGVLATLFAGIIAFTLGMSAGFFGGWIDALLSRILDVVLGIPLILASIVFLKRLNNATSADLGVWPVVLVLSILGWTTAARVVRSSVISAKQQDYVQAARMLGAGNGRIMLRHILPNAMAPAIVVLTIALGAFIATEATLSFLGVGLKPSTISWGGMISDAQARIRQAAWPVLWPGAFLAMTVLAFIMLGDAIRDAFDPRLR